MTTSLFDAYEIKKETKTYITKIRRIRCKEIINDEYVLEIKTAKHENSFLFKKGNNFITDDSLNKVIYLTDETKKIIENEVEKINYFVSNNINKNKIEMPKYDITLNLFRNDYFNYAAIIRCKDYINNPIASRIKIVDKIKIVKNIHIYHFLHSLKHCAHETMIYKVKLNENSLQENKVFIEKDINESFNNIDKNIKKYLLGYAEKNKDLVLRSQIRLYYNEDDNSDVEYFSKLANIKILPTLNRVYDTEFYVETETIDFDLLQNSGYNISHRAYFAMKNSTKEYYTLNPHTKSGVDASPIDCEKITFNEYLEIFNKNNQ